MLRRFAKWVARKMFSDWPGNQAPAMTLLSKPITTAQRPETWAMPSTTLVAPFLLPLGL